MQSLLKVQVGCVSVLMLADVVVVCRVKAISASIIFEA